MLTVICSPACSQDGCVCYYTIVKRVDEKQAKEKACKQTSVFSSGGGLKPV